MIDLEQLIDDELGRLYPRLPASEEWEDVLGRAGSTQATGLGRPPRPRGGATRTWARRAAGLAAGCAVALAGAVAVVVFAHRQGMSFTDRALAALGKQPVLFAAVRIETPAAPGSVNGVLQLSTGRLRPHTTVTEYWYQARPRRLEIRYLRDGKVVDETYNTATQGLSSEGFRSKPGGYELAPDPALADFLNGYRAALEHHKARVVGHGTVGGRKVTWLSIPLPTGHDRDLVAVDTATYRPLRFRVVYPNHRYQAAWEIVTSIKTVSVQAANFGLPKVVPQPSFGRVLESTPISPRQAAGALSQAALWPGARTGRLPLIALDRQRLRDSYPRKQRRPPIDGTELELLYGSKTANGRLDWTKPHVQIDESTRPQTTEMFNVSLAGAMTWGYDPLPPAGWLAINSISAIGITPGGHVPLSQMSWIGQLQQDGLYLTIQASSRTLLLNTVHQLHQIT